MLSGIIDKIKAALVKHFVVNEAKDAQSGKLGTTIKSVVTLLDGWKAFIVAAVLTWKALCHDCAAAGYAAPVIRALGWDQVNAAFDPTQAAIGLATTYALGHHLWKAIQQYRAGVPLLYLHTEQGALIAKDAAGIEKVDEAIPPTPKVA